MPYPRICGANGGTRLRACSQFPLPPRTWGKPHPGGGAPAARPSTPTHVGQTGLCCEVFPLGGLYPHARGANLLDREGLAIEEPLPPRTWGKLLPDEVSDLGAASTPTHVGQTDYSAIRASRPALYPHARGANPAVGTAEGGDLPLPPRTWGKPMSSADRLVENASTPTHVGQTSPSRSPLPPTSLYPHARGANLIGLGILLLKAPLPPRTWGKPTRPSYRAAHPASTPTHVGQTSTPGHQAPPDPLYPHARGANLEEICNACVQEPLPPRTWGKRTSFLTPHPRGPSTPPHVGQTWSVGLRSWRTCLYPHARGANAAVTVVRKVSLPLPPRTWGKH